MQKQRKCPAFILPRRLFATTNSASTWHGPKKSNEYYYWFCPYNSLPYTSRTILGWFIKLYSYNPTACGKSDQFSFKIE